MSSHFHLLIHERKEAIAKTIKRISDAYVYYYNRKYQRNGQVAISSKSVSVLSS